MNKTQVIIGMFQLMTAVFLVGWIVSIYWGYLIVEKSEGGHQCMRPLVGNGPKSDDMGPNAQVRIGARSNPQN